MHPGARVAVCEAGCAPSDDLGLEWTSGLLLLLCLLISGLGCGSNPWNRKAWAESFCVYEAVFTCSVFVHIWEQPAIY